jgi:hypothetical protein
LARRQQLSEAQARLAIDGHWGTLVSVRRLLLVLLLALLPALPACGDDESTAAQPEEPCGENTPLVSWDTFGQAFLSTYCQGCHASTAPDRQSAPDSVVFDTEEDALMFKEFILTVATGDTPTMPPNGGPTEDDRERLSVWLTCFAQ